MVGGCACVRTCVHVCVHVYVFVATGLVGGCRSLDAKGEEEWVRPSVACRDMLTAALHVLTNVAKGQQDKASQLLALTVSK